MFLEDLRFNLLGVKVSATNIKDAQKRIEQLISSDLKGYISVTGVHGLMEAQIDTSFRQVLNNSFMVTPDGMPLVWIGKYKFGYKNIGRVYGPDLMLALCEMSQEKKYRHFFYGGRDGVGDLLKERLLGKFPKLNVVGMYTPPFRPLNQHEENELIGLVREAAPDILWVGLSTPKQEKFMSAYLNRLDTKVMIGVGAAFDFHSGQVRQAPFWIQRSGFEWLFRLFLEPKRLWRRYLYNNSKFIYLFGCQICKLK